MGQFNLFQVDAFVTEYPFSGNPAAVCLLDSPANESWMQDFAAEMNLSETAFLNKIPDGYRLRWFTPAVEVDLCGHATLAAAHILWEEGLLPKDEQARFHTRSGLLKAHQIERGICMDFPSEPALEPVDVATVKIIEEALGMPVVSAFKNRSRYLVELGSEKDVRVLEPDFGALKTLAVPGMVVTAQASKEYDFVSRYFAPQKGVLEDPVTGSAHCTLAPFWSRKLGKSAFHAHQVSFRGGALTVELREDRVWLSGKARVVFRGLLCV